MEFLSCLKKYDLDLKYSSKDLSDLLKESMNAAMKPYDPYASGEALDSSAGFQMLTGQFYCTTFIFEWYDCKGKGMIMFIGILSKV